MKPSKNEAAGGRTPTAGQIRGIHPSFTDTDSISREHPHFNPLLKASDVARLLNISRTSAYRLMREGLPVVRFGEGIVRVRLADLEVYVASRVEGGE